MKWSHEVEWSAEQLPAATWPPERWAQWMPGIEVVSSNRGEVELAVHGPIPHRALVDVEHSNRSLSVQQLEGRARHAGLTLRIEQGKLRAELEVDAPHSIPGSLRRELREVWLQEALRALTAS